MALVVRFTVRELPRGLREQQSVSLQQYSIHETWQFFASLTTGKRVSLAAALHAFAAYAGGTWGPAFFIRVHHMTPGEVGLWLSWIVALGGGLGTFAGGWLADRWIRSEPRARAYVSMIGVLLSIPFSVASLLLPNQQLALLCNLPANFFGTMWMGPSLAIIQDLVPPTMRATAAAVYLFIVTIIGLGAGPQTVGILNDWIGTPDAVRYSLLASSMVMSLGAGFFYWRAGKSLVQDLEAKKRLLMDFDKQVR
jgi:MFS family permease